MKNITINSKSYALALSMLDPKVKVVDAYIWGTWLCLQLDSGVKFKIKN